MTLNKYKMMEPRYFLQKHIFLCHSGDHVVILDLKEHRYRAFAAKGMESLCTVVSGWPILTPAVSNDVEVQCRNEKRNELALSLVRQGILTSKEDIGKSGTSAITVVPTAELLSESDNEDQDPIRFSDLLKFAMAFVVASIKRKWFSLERIVKSVDKRNVRLKRKAKSLDIDSTRRLVRNYIRLRPLFLASRNACFIEALILSNFLAYHGAYANWVFGVRMKPWLAHCWLQVEGVVLNDTLENIKIFTPIMVV